MSNVNENLRNDLKRDNAYSIILVDNLTNDTELIPIIKLDDPFHIDWSTIRPGQFCTLDKVYDLLRDLINYKQTLDGVTESNRITLSEEWNPEDIAEHPAGEGITIKLINREPGRMSADGKSRPNYAPNFESKFRDPNLPNNVITVESIVKDHVIELSCWATEAKLANQRALWLERTLFEQKHNFPLNGIQNWRYEQRLSDMVIKQSEQRIHQRPIRYFFRLYEPVVHMDPQISNIQFRVNL